MNTIESQKHKPVRSFLRIAGPLFALAGVVFVAIGLISFFSAFGGFEPPKFFWCIFAGMPLLFAGIVMSQYGYFGAVARYIAAESAPVARDAVNYMAEGTKEAVKTVAGAVAEGVEEARTKKSNRQ